MVTPRDKVRLSIIERNRYNPVSPEKAHRANVPGWKGIYQPLERHDGDLELGADNGNTTGASRP